MTLVLSGLLDIPVSAGREIIKAYFGDYDVVHDDETVFAIMAEAIGDVVFNCPANLLTSKASKQGRGAYKYVFAHRPSFSRWPTDVGVGHADDLPFMLGSLVTLSGAQNRDAALTGQSADVPTRTKVSPQELNFTNDLLLLMSSFLKTG
ncbi:putative carboxylesterase, partial [Ixodes scapularis]